MSRSWSTYTSWAITENPNLTPQMGFDQGFQGFSAFPKSLDAETITRRLFEQAAQIQSRPPYFLYLHYIEVHAPYRARPPLFDPGLEGDARRISAYDSGIHTVDDHIRRAFEGLGWERDTLVIVTADHGEELGDRGHFGHGATLYAEVLDVPLVVFPPGGLGRGRRVADRVSLIEERKHQTLTLDCDAAVNLSGAERELYSAFTNLVTNAIRYTPEGGSIRLRWWADQNGGYFSVTDTGVGIAAQHIPRLTERFYRVDVSRSRDSGGTGLDLAIVKHVLNRHRARLRIESRQGQGSTFTCEFPAALVLRRHIA